MSETKLLRWGTKDSFVSGYRHDSIEAEVKNQGFCKVNDAVYLMVYYVGGAE